MLYHQNYVKLAGVLTSEPRLINSANGPLVKTSLMTQMQVESQSGGNYIKDTYHTIVFDYDMAVDFTGKVQKGSFVTVEGFLRYWKNQEGIVKAEVKCYSFQVG